MLRMLCAPLCVFFTFLIRIILNFNYIRTHELHALYAHIRVTLCMSECARVCVRISTLYVDCYWTLTFSSTCHAHRNKIYRNYERHIPNKIRKTSNWAWKSFGEHGTYSQQIEAELLATYIFFENSITLITTTTILNSPFFSFSLS